jgi:hypothetical protein
MIAIADAPLKPRQLVYRRWFQWLKWQEKEEWSTSKIAEVTGTPLRSVQYGIQQARKMRDTVENVVEKTHRGPR